MKAQHQSTILLVDDNEALLESLVMFFSDEYQVLTASSGQSAIEVIQKQPDIATVVMDIKMPGMDGIVAASEIRHLRPEVPVIFLTGYPGDYDEQDIRRREKPADFILKGEDPRRLVSSVRDAVNSYQIRCGSPVLAQMMAAEHGMVGQSDIMLEVYRKIHACAGNDSVIMLRGETGTGKDLVARALHMQSARRHGKFVQYICSSKSPELCESDLFGHVKGAFTSSVSDRPGRFETAHGGTLFLNEVANIDLNNQVKLLHVLDTGKYSPLGGVADKISDARVISATNEHLETMLEDKRFRQDLYSRLCGVRIDLPPLRERRDDIPLLIARFNQMAAASQDRQPKIFAQSAMDVLLEFDWPGNVRQLMQVVNALVLQNPSDLIVADDCLTQIPGLECCSTANGMPPTLGESLKMDKTQRIEQALKDNDNNIAAAARTLGVDRSNLRKLIFRLGIKMR